MIPALVPRVLRSLGGGREVELRLAHRTPPRADALRQPLQVDAVVELPPAVLAQLAAED